MVYLIHFDRPYKHAQHYLGYVGGALQNRIDRHRAGNGSRLLQVIQKAGIEWKVVRIWPDGDRELEHRLKQHSNTRNCPICNSKIKHLLYVPQSTHSR